MARVVRALRDPLVIVLLGALVLTLVTADFTDAAVIALVVLVNTTLAVRQEVSADRAVRALSSLVSPSARVTRDGREQSVPVADLVPGGTPAFGPLDVKAEKNDKWDLMLKSKGQTEPQAR